MLLQILQLGANSAADIRIPQLIHSVPATKTNSVSKRKKSAVKSTSIIKEQGHMAYTKAAINQRLASQLAKGSKCKIHEGMF